MKRILRITSMLLVLAVLLGTLVLAAPGPGVLTSAPEADLAWNQDGRSLTVTVQNVSGECFLLVLPAAVDAQGSPSDYSLSLAEAVFVAQATAQDGTIVFDPVFPESWPDTVLVLTGAELDGPQVLGTVRVSAGGFTDVPAAAWYYEAVTYGASQGLIAGYPDGSFQPGSSITAGQYLTILYRWLSAELDFLPGRETSGADWLEGASALNSALYLEADLTAPMTRYETARLTALVLTYAADQGLALNQREAVPFLDVPSDSPYAQAASFLQSVYGVDGYPEPEGYSFRGDNGITRAEAAQVLYNIFTRSLAE